MKGLHFGKLLNWGRNQKMSSEVVKITEETSVRHKFMNEQDYAPYCGNGSCMGRAPFNGKQFQCVRCNWISQYPNDFLIRYKKKWDKE